jgi:hypothetical protein
MDKRKLSALEKTLPKTADGFRIGLGMKAWYPWSIDSFAGPHPVKVIAISKEYCKYDSGYEKASIAWDSIFAKKANAERAKKGLYPIKGKNI